MQVKGRRMGKLFIPKYYESMKYYVDLYHIAPGGYADLYVHSIRNPSGQIVGTLDYFIDRTRTGNERVLALIASNLSNQHVTPVVFSENVKRIVDEIQRRGLGHQISAIFLAISGIALQHGYPQDLANCFGVPVFAPAGDIDIQEMDGGLPACVIIRNDQQNQLKSFVSHGAPTGGRFWKAF